VNFLIDADKLPLSSPVGAWLSGQDDEDVAFKTLITAGDDYELIFTASPNTVAEIKRTAKIIGVRVSKVGTVKNGTGISVISDGKAMRFTKTGHMHF